MGDAVAIGNLAYITSCVGEGGGGELRCVFERERETGRSRAGRGRRGKGEGIKEEGREYQ